jgi:hypothetical protein
VILIVIGLILIAVGNNILKRLNNPNDSNPVSSTAHSRTSAGPSPSSKGKGHRDPSTKAVANSRGFLDEFHGSTLGIAYGIAYTQTPYGNGAVFSRLSESRIQYPFSQGLPTEGTLELLLKIDSGYRYTDYRLLENQDSALIFTTDIAGGDVTWPGSAWLWVSNNGDVSFNTAREKYKVPSILRAEKTGFNFGEWHSIGISFGSRGQHILVDGNLVASNTGNTQPLGSGGNHNSPIDVPTIGESVSGFWNNNQHEGGFEGTVARLRASPKQLDWVLSKQ